MPRKQTQLRDDHYTFINDSLTPLSALVRRGLNEAMDGERELPERRQRVTAGYDLHRTSVSIDEEHAAFINDHDFVFSIFVHDLIEERIEDERKLKELGE